MIRKMVCAPFLIAAFAYGKVLTLQQAEQEAITTGYSVREQYFKERSTEWEKRTVIAQYLPVADYSLGYIRMDDETVENANAGFDMFVPPGRDFENPNRLYKSAFSHSFTVSQPITNGGAEAVAIVIAGHAKRAVELEAESVRQEALYSVRTAYFNACMAREALLVARRDFVWAGLNLGKSRTRHAAGAVPSTDLLQWEAETAQKESDVALAEADAVTAIAALFQAMGRPSGQADTAVRLQPVRSFERLYEQGSVPMNVEIDALLAIRILREHVAVQKGYRTMAVTGFFPKLNAHYSYSWRTWERMRPQTEYPGWTAGISLSVPIFHGFRNSTSYKKADFAYRRVLVAMQNARSAAALDLGRIIRLYRAMYGAVAASAKRRDLMTRQLAIMQARYDGGLVNQTQLLDVSRNAQQARMGYVKNLFDCLALEAEYRKTLGILEASR